MLCPRKCLYCDVNVGCDITGSIVLCKESQRGERQQFERLYRNTAMDRYRRDWVEVCAYTQIRGVALTAAMISATAYVMTVS